MSMIRNHFAHSGPLAIASAVRGSDLVRDGGFKAILDENARSADESAIEKKWPMQDLNDDGPSFDDKAPDERVDQTDPSPADPVANPKAVAAPEPKPVESGASNRVGTPPAISGQQKNAVGLAGMPDGSGQGDGSAIAHQLADGSDDGLIPIPNATGGKGQAAILAAGETAGSQISGLTLDPSKATGAGQLQGMIAIETLTKPIKKELLGLAVKTAQDTLAANGTPQEAMSPAAHLTSAASGQAKLLPDVDKSMETYASRLEWPSVDTPENDSAIPRADAADGVSNGPSAAAGLDGRKVSIPGADRHILRHVVEQIAVQIEHGRQGQTALFLQLAELGKVRIVMRPQDSGLVLRIFADNPETDALMRRHIDVLQHDFRELGYLSIDIQFAENQAGTRDGALDRSTDRSEIGPAILPSSDAPELGFTAPTLPVATGTGLDLRL